METQQTIKLFEQHGDKGYGAFVLKSEIPGKFRVVTWDYDLNEVVGVIIYSDCERAMDMAKRIATGMS